jgi:hypothetical protein
MNRPSRSNAHPHSRLLRKKTFWSLRYKVYVAVLLVIVIPLIAFTNANVPATVSFIGAREIPINPIYTEVVRRSNDSIAKLVNDIIDTNSIQVRDVGVATGDIEKSLEDQINRAKTLPLDKLIPRPANAKLKSFIKYPAYPSVSANIVWSELKDLFETNEDGSLKKNSAGEFIPIEEKQEDIRAGNYLSVPIQRLLVEGVVHLAWTIDPGEIGNSYIVGHTSNFSSVKSAYNFIFKPLERTSKVGEEFFIYDKYGRELKFRVFEVLDIDAENKEEIKIAYRQYTDRRVVTLQGSILVNGQPTRRWLTRGELVFP